MQNTMSEECCGYEQEQERQAASPVKPYEVRGDGPGAFRIVHHTPDRPVTRSTYYVRRDARRGLRCSCPGYRFKGACKHQRYVAGLMGMPAPVHSDAAF